MPTRSRSLVLLAALTVVLPACESAEDVGQKAGIEYIAPFLGLAEAQTEGCAKQLEVAKHMLDLGKDQRAELAPKVAKVKGEESFTKALHGFTDRVKGGTTARFAEQCPEQAVEFAKVAKQTADELGIADLVPAWPPEG